MITTTSFSQTKPIQTSEAQNKKPGPELYRSFDGLALSSRRFAPIVLYYVMLYYVILCYVILCYIILGFVSHHIISHYIILHYAI